MLYRIKKTFSFKSPYQARTFLEIAEIYGKGRTFGAVVIYEASLEFSVWRKLQNLAKIVSKYTIENINIHTVSEQAGFKAFRDVSL